MPVRIRITLFFALIVFAILSLFSIAIYYFAYSNRQQNFNNRLKNRAVTTAHLLIQSEIFNQAMIQKIDASTAVTMQNKSIQAYDSAGNRIYAYADNPGDTIPIDKEILKEAEEKQFVSFNINNKDVIVYHYADDTNNVIIITGAYDVEGLNNLKELQYILTGCFLGGILIAVAGGFFFSKGLLWPIRKIADEVNDISAQNLTRRIKSYEGKDEWSYLTDTLNQLFDRLEESFKTQSTFIANASHELSTPLTSVSSQLEVSLQKDRNADEYKRVMRSILHDVHHLSKLTQTLLEFAKASGTPNGLQINLVRIDEILLRMPAEMSKLNNEYHVELFFDNLPEEEEKLLVFGNEDLLFTAVKNIVINACKYSSDHLAAVKLSVLYDKIEIEINDKGKGIPYDELKKIFQPFYRVDDDMKEDGFGLGLSLVSRIIKLHRGHINVESELNEGTSFIVHLPVAGFKK
jgi:two-component system, OmpR family, sensor histidine kinase ArlS